MVEQGNKQVRVDNWGTFFLQRLQVFFAKTDYCDLTLQFDGNVQLKVHRLVMNACTEYFRFLEETCPALEENTIIMPQDLQSDVIVPIVNFMYTGILEFHVSVFEKLYKAAESMNITILTKLLDAQKITNKKVTKTRSDLTPPKKPVPPPPPPPSHKQVFLDLPSPLPARKVSTWKRKTVSPAPALSSHPPSQLHYDQKWSGAATDPLAENTPKPTRFEWPDEDLPSFCMLGNSFEDISYTSKPLLTKEEEEKIKPNFDDLRQNVELPKKITSKSCTNAVSLKDMAEFAKEQKIRNSMFEDLDELNEMGQKRKPELSSPAKVPTKKIKISNKENKETTISVESVTPGDIDHTKIVTEILKKYPDLVKKNKNIKLKIMPGNKDTTEKKIVNAIVEPIKQPASPTEVVIKSAKVQPQKQSIQKKKQITGTEEDDEGPWTCKKCVSSAGEVQEFVLYYLYRKHMTDVHDEVFDVRLCKYCGRRCNTHNLMLYHLYTKHALKPPTSYNFPKCNRCPYISLSAAKLAKHKELHDVNEIQCQDCQLAFVSAQHLNRHIRVTGHYNKPGRISYDCQYCMKKLQSGMTLFSHVKKCHLNEANIDGMVCFDDLETLEDMEEDEESTEYVLPEMMNETTLQKDKVKIISNVKVSANRQDSSESTQQSQLVPMEASSEAEALNNVATGIATSLGLVDIVVLDDSQQYILQQDGQSEQTEFILPELTHGQPFSGQVITTQDNSVIQQGMIQSSTGDIASTDELVMVLTDHDYPDEHGGENPDNSNIVVLYSHPVDGQEGQFITSQGNLMVNSQTGMLELRNGSTISTSAASQMIVTNSVDSPIESIEMIQREINSHTSELKQEPAFEEEKKTEIQLLVPEQAASKIQTIADIQNISEDTEELPPENQSGELNLNEETAMVKGEEQIVEQSKEANENSVQIQTEVQEHKGTSVDNVDGSMDVSIEAMEIDVDHKTAETQEQNEIIVQEESEEYQTENIGTLAQQPQDNSNEPDIIANVYATGTDVQNEGSEGVDVPPETSDIHQVADLTESSFVETDTSFERQELSVGEITQESQLMDEGEPMEIDGQVPDLPRDEEEMRDHEQEMQENNEQQDNHKILEEQSNTAIEENVEHCETSQIMEETETIVLQTEEIAELEEKEDAKPEAKEVAGKELENEVAELEENKVSQQAEETEQLPQEGAETLQHENKMNEIEMETSNEIETETSSIEEKTATPTTESSKPQEPVRKIELNKNAADINKTILDDWADDTDSQQSERNCNESESQAIQVSQPEGCSAVDNVNKLMDDWDEEEEDEKKD